MGVDQQLVSAHLYLTSCYAMHRVPYNCEAPVALPPVPRSLVAAEPQTRVPAAGASGGHLYGTPLAPSPFIPDRRTCLQLRRIVYLIPEPNPGRRQTARDSLHNPNTGIGDGPYPTHMWLLDARLCAWFGQRPLLRFLWLQPPAPRCLVRPVPVLKVLVTPTSCSKVPGAASASSEGSCDPHLLTRSAWCGKCHLRFL